MSKNVGVWLLLFSMLFLSGCVGSTGQGSSVSGSTPSETLSLKASPTGVVSTATSQPVSQIQGTATHIPATTDTRSPAATGALPTPTPQPGSQIQKSPPPISAPTETQPPVATEALPTSTSTDQPTVAPSQPNPTQTQAGPDTCIDTAAYVDDLTIPDGTSFKPGTAFVKTWQIKNAGTCTWGANYTLVFHSGDIMDGPLSSPMPTIAPGEIGSISVNLKAPASGGAFTGNWEFQSPTGRRFGVNSNGIDLIWVKIGVSIFDENGTPAPVIGVNSPMTTPEGCTPQQNHDFEQQILAMINSARSDNGLPSLTLQSQLSTAAYGHSADMGCNRYVDHAGSDGSTWFTRIKAQKYNYLYASENIYVGDPAFGGDPNGAFTWWMNSPVHRDNILSPKVTQIGVGYAFVDKSPYEGYYTLDFARK